MYHGSVGHSQPAECYAWTKGATMGKIRVLYFAALRDLAARDEEWLELPQGPASVGEVLLELERVRPVLAGRLGSVRAALNETFVSAAEPVSAGDTLALIPPVSGG